MKPPAQSGDPNITPTDADLNTSLVTFSSLGSLATKVTIYSLHTNQGETEKIMLYQGRRNDSSATDLIGLVDLNGKYIASWNELYCCSKVLSLYGMFKCI